MKNFLVYIDDMLEAIEKGISFTQGINLTEIYENALDFEIVSEYESREKQSTSNLLTIKELLD